MRIYKLTNNINNKCYVGLETTNIGDRYRSHKSKAKNGSPYPLHRAINKYGEENFSFEILEECNSIEELASREIHWIAHFQSNYIGYNCTPGGETGRYDTISAYVMEGITAQRVATRSKLWEAVDSNGKLYKFYNLRGFCRENNLETALMHLVVQGRQSHHKGWTCWEIDENGNRIERNLSIRFKRHCSWILLSPNNEEVATDNLKEFCLANELAYKQMHKVAAGLRLHHRGWRVKARSNV